MLRINSATKNLLSPSEGSAFLPCSCRIRVGVLQLQKQKAHRRDFSDCETASRGGWRKGQVIAAESATARSRS
jgi:hypothetical protein